MKITELIKKLEDLKDKEGDIEVLMSDSIHGENNIGNFGVYKKRLVIFPRYAVIFKK